MAVSSSLHVGSSLFPSRRHLVRSSSSSVKLFPKILPTSPSPAISLPSPAISLKLGSRRTAALRRRLKPVQARHGCASESELTFYPHKFAQLLALLPTIPDIRARCRLIERYGEQLPCVPTPFVTASNRVEGLPERYNTYVHAFLDPSDPARVYFYVNSEAAHIRGLARILTGGLSWSPVRTIADMSLAPFALLIGQSLLPAGWCSQFMLLLEHMQRKARELVTNTGTVGISYYNSKNKEHAVKDVLSIMGLETRHIVLKDEIDKTNVVHELFSTIGLDADADDEGDDDVHVYHERQKYDEDNSLNSFDNEDDDGLSWRVKYYPPMHSEYVYLGEDNSDSSDSIASSIPLRWG